MRGLLPKIKEDLWPRLPRTYNYQTLCEAAYTAEATMMSKEINDDSKVNAVIAGMSLHEKQQDREIAMAKEELAMIKEELAKYMALKSNSRNKSQGSGANTPTVAAIGPDSQNNQGYRRSRRDSGPVRFDLSRNRSHSKESNYQRSRSLDKYQSPGRSYSYDNHGRSTSSQSRSPGRYLQQNAHSHQHHTQNQHFKQPICAPYHNPYGQQFNPRLPLPAIQTRALPQHYRPYRPNEWY